LGLKEACKSAKGRRSGGKRKGVLANPSGPRSAKRHPGKKKKPGPESPPWGVRRQNGSTHHDIQTHGEDPEKRGEGRSPVGDAKPLEKIGIQEPGRSA